MMIILRIVWLLVTLAVISPLLKPFFIESMSRFMLLHIPLLVILGYLAARLFKLKLGGYNYFGISGLIFFAGSILFWMIPHSLDTAVFSNWGYQIMHLNLLLAGFLLARSIPSMTFVLKIAFGIYLIAMLLSLGILYVHSTALICATFSVEQQWTTGHYLLWICGILFVSLLIKGGFLLRAKPSA